MPAACLWIALALFVLDGCAYFRRMPRLPILEGPVRGAVISSPQPFLKAVQERRDSFRDLQAMALVSIQSPWGKLRAHQLIRLRKTPSFLRMETLGPIGPSLYILADEEQLLLYNPYEGRLLKGKASPDQIRKLIRLPLAIPEMVNLLAGLPPPLADGHFQVSLTHQSENERYWVQISSAENQPYQKAWMGADMTLQGCQLYDSKGRVSLIARYGAYHPVDGYPLPRGIQLYLPQEKTFLELTYQDPSVNEGLPDFLLELPIPPGVEAQEME